MTFYMHIMYIEIVGCGKFGCNILKNNKNRPIVFMTAMRYMGSISIKFFVHIIYMEKLRYSKFGFKIWKNNRNRPIVCMAIRYITPI